MYTLKPSQRGQTLINNSEVLKGVDSISEKPIEEKKGISRLSGATNMLWKSDKFGGLGKLTLGDNAEEHTAKKGNANVKHFQLKIPGV